MSELGPIIKIVTLVCIGIPTGSDVLALEIVSLDLDRLGGKGLTYYALWHVCFMRGSYRN